MTDIQTIKDRLKLEDLIAESFTLTGKGRQLSTQEHDSLKIRTDWQRWYWYSRGTSGDLIDWYMQQYNCDFRSALEDLARRAGVEVAPLTPERQQALDRQRAQDAIFRLAAAHYHRQLLASPTALAYCQKERCWTLDTIQREQIGYVPYPGEGQGGGATDNKDLSVELRAAGLLTHPAAKAVLSIPAGMIVYVHQERGRVVYLSGRSIEGKRHYNLPVDIIGAKPVYTNDVDRRTCDAHLLVEGQADAISLGQLGIPATALCGVAVAELAEPRRYSHIALDNDKAGQTAALDLALAVDPLCRIVTWPKTLRHRLENKGTINSKDANDLLKGYLEDDTIATLLDNAPTAIQALAALAGKAKNDERKDLITRFFAIYSALDEMVATDLKPDLADLLCGSMSQFNRLLKAHEKANEPNGDDYSEQHKISPGGFVGGYLFEQCVYETNTGELGCYYWVRTPDGKFEKKQSLQIGNIAYWPVDPREEELIQGRDVLFATDRAESGTEAELLRDIRAFIHYWLDVPAYYENIASYYVLLTWFYDAGYETIPYLRALGEFGSGKSRFLNTIGHICFRPMLFGGGDSEATIYYTLETFKGTMIIDESDFRDSDESALISKIINMGNNRRGSIKRLEAKPSGNGYKVRRFNVFGPKIFGAREGFGDQASDSRCLTHYTTSIVLRPDIPIDLDATFDQQTQRLRNRLLDFRLKHWKPATIDNTDIDRTIMARLAQITSALKSIIKDPDVIDELSRFIRLYNQSLVGDRQMTEPAIVVEALCRIRYPRPSAVEIEPDWSIANIANVAQEIAKDFDPDQKMTPKRVGHLLSKQLGIIRRSGRDHRGRDKIAIDDQELAGLMHRYGITKPDADANVDTKN